MSSNVSKPGFLRSISIKTQKTAFEYENDGELTTIYLNYPPRGQLSRTTSTNKITNKPQSKAVKYCKSSSQSNTLFNGIRSSSHFALASNQRDNFTQNVLNHQNKITEKLKIISQQNFYLLSHCLPSSFIVCVETSTRYTVNIGPQTCSCLNRDGINVSSFPCVHLLFIMCKVLQVHEKDPLLLADRLQKVEVDELFQRFNKRRKEKLKNPYRPNDNIIHSHNVSEEKDKHMRRGTKLKEILDGQRLSESLDEITCSICLQEMNISQPLIFCHNCTNEFHEKCISIWMKECKKNKEDQTCPLCRNSWSPDNLNKNAISPLENSSVLSGSNLISPRSSAVSEQHINHFEMTNMTSSTSDFHSSNSSFNIAGSKHSLNISVTHKPIGYCFSDSVAQMLTSDMCEKREAALRQVAQQTVRIVLSAGSSYSVEGIRQNSFSDNIVTDIVSSIGGHTTGLMLKEAFRVIALLLDDTNYSLFVGALRAFREILGFLICRTENDVERMSRMISPILCQLLRICGDSSHKKKSQMCLSTLFELAKGQEGGMALGREIKKASLPVTEWQRLAKFTISDHHRFEVIHCYGRLSLLEKLLDKFDLTSDILKKLLEFVTFQLLLMYRSMHLLSSLESGKIGSLENTDADTGLSASDIQLLAGARIHKLAKTLFINTAKLTISKLKFNGWSLEDIYVELGKDLNKLPQIWKDKFVTKLKIPMDKNVNCEKSEMVKQSVNKEKIKLDSAAVIIPSNTVSKGYRISKRCSQIKSFAGINKISSLQTANSVNSLKVRAGNVTNIIRSSSGDICRISPFIRITPEPAYDVVPLSESDDEMSDETSSAFFSELAIHNSIYGHQFGLQESRVKICDQEEIDRINSIFRKILCEQANLKDKNINLDLESQPPPGLGVFSTEYRSGYEWYQGTLLGTGAFSKCFQGRDVRTGLLMAVKQICIGHNCIEKNKEIIKAVKTEVNLMIQLHHPNVLPLLGAVFSPSDNTISMFVRWMPGGSVASLLSQYSPFLESVTLAYALQTIRGLSYIHSKRILHRDLKGANLLLDSSGMRLRISDFGASARLSNGRDSNASDFKGQLLGTVAFMAPEVLRGEEYGRSCDVWSLACCIIEMLTGSQPWRDRNHTNHLALMYTIASAEEPPKLPEQISADLTDLLIECLNRDPKKRPLSSNLESYKVFKHLIP